MKAPLTYKPAYIGLFASLWLALVCNSFLDIQYGGFAFEVFFWAAIHGWTLRVAWLQQGQVSESGQQKQKIVLFVGLAMFFVIFLPMWGFPRAGLYLLAMLQASQNCVTTTRRQLHLGLLVSAVMVMFAASHYRADWTMLFYLLPYIIAVVFTLVSEQISRRAQSVRETSLRDTGPAGQSVAIAAATSIILGLAAIFYFMTPQLSWPYLYSQYGQLSNLGWLGGSSGQGQSGQAEGETGQGAGGQGASSSEGNSSGDANGAGQGYSPSPWSGWPTPGQMREAAGRPGMPGWQSEAIGELADLTEVITESLAPITEAIEELLNDLKEWLKKNRSMVLVSLFALMLLMMLIAILLLLREAKAGVWVRTRFDYWYLVVLERHSSGSAGATQFYRAMERLFLLAETPRSQMSNVREFLREATYYRGDMRPAATELTFVFEECRYGIAEPTADQIQAMRRSYQQLFRLQAR